MATAAELRAQAEALLAQALEQEAADKKKVFEKVMDLLGKAGLTIEELSEFANPPKVRKSAGPVAAKYRGPNGETWAGRGHAPQWIVDLKAKGESLDRYLIK